MLKKLILLSLVLYSCSNDIEEINALLQKEEIKSEIARDIELIYSDSAEVKMKIDAPVLRRSMDKNYAIEEFDEGLKANFYGPGKRVNGWLEAKYAIRRERKKEILVRDSVVLWNKNNEKLETSELIWNEEKEILSTNKFVRITKPSRADTSYGYGFESNADFTRFEIKNFSSKMNSNEISNALGNNEKN